MEKRNSTSLTLLILYALLICALLVLTLSGARFYQAAVSGKTEHYRSRNAMAYIQSQAAAFDGQDSVRLESWSGGTALCLEEPETGYVTRIYLYRGALRSALSQSGLPLDPDSGDRVCDLSTLSLEWQPGGILKICADGRVGYVCCSGGETGE